MKAVIVGTAGHIDHGKSALVRALTGTDPDRLEEEKRRGITIDIGFAHVDLTAPEPYSVPGVAERELIRIGFVDVPGHERFVRNMLAGIGGIDLVLLVIAADEGIKPQTREHFDICSLLAIQRGITVLTKADLVDEETLQVVTLEVGEFLRGSFLDPARSPIVAVSSQTGQGLDRLRAELARVAAEIPAKDSTAAFRLPIDRVFTMKGFGTVVTGTLISGTVEREQELEVHPLGKRVRVRGVQVHGAAAERAVAGQRTALNLVGAEVSDLARGMMLTAPQLFRPVTRVSVKIDLLRPPPGSPTAAGFAVVGVADRARVHFHAFTAETIAQVRLLGAKRLPPGESGLAELKLERPLLLLPGDRFIIRQFSPVITIGGGRVLDAVAPPKRAKSKLESWAGMTPVAAGDSTSTSVPETGRRSTTVPTADGISKPSVSTLGNVPSDTESRPGRHTDFLSGAKSRTEAQLEFLRRLLHASAPSFSPSSGEKVGTREELLLRAARRGAQGLSLSDAVAETGWQPKQLERIAGELAAAGELSRFEDRLLASAWRESLGRHMLSKVDAFHRANPLQPGINKDELRESLGLEPEVFRGVLNSLVQAKKLEVSGEVVHAAGKGVVLRDEEAESKSQIERVFRDAGLKVPLLKDVIAALPIDKARAQKIVTLLLRDRVLIKLSDELVFHRDALAAMRTRILSQKAATPKINVGTFKDLFGITRKHAIPLLEYLDRERVTRRVGDERIIL